MGGRSQDEALADQREPWLGQFRLKELILRSGEEIGNRSGDSGYEVVNRDRLAVQCALLICIGGELDGCDGAGPLGADGP